MKEPLQVEELVVKLERHFKAMDNLIDNSLVDYELKRVMKNSYRAGMGLAIYISVQQRMHEIIRND